MEMKTKQKYSDNQAKMLSVLERNRGLWLTTTVIARLAGINDSQSNELARLQYKLTGTPNRLTQKKQGRQLSWRYETRIRPGDTIRARSGAKGLVSEVCALGVWITCDDPSPYSDMGNPVGVDWRDISSWDKGNRRQ